MSDEKKKNVATGAAAVVGAAAGVAGAAFIPHEAEAAETNNTDDAEVLAAEQPQEAQASQTSGASHTAQHGGASSAHVQASAAGQHPSGGNQGGGTGQTDNQTQETQDHPVDPQKPETTDDPTNPVNPANPENPEHPVNPEHPETPGNDDIHVYSYETVTADDGSQADVAVIGVNGQAVVVADTTMDGYANFAASDTNGNGQIEDNEIVDVSGQGIAMQPFHDAAPEATANVDPGADPDNTIASNDPDYINDGNVDDFMA